VRCLDVDVAIGLVMCSLLWRYCPARRRDGPGVKLIHRRARHDCRRPGTREIRWADRLPAIDQRDGLRSWPLAEEFLFAEAQSLERICFRWRSTSLDRSLDGWWHDTQRPTGSYAYLCWRVILSGGTDLSVSTSTAKTDVT
jgi:hypothetical protein